MTPGPGMQRLLSNVLALQNEDGRGAELTDERVKQVLLGRDAFTAAEERMLATSPLARLIYAEVLEDLRLEEEAFAQRCERAGVKTETHSLLAASGGQYPMVLPSDDFSVTLCPHPVSAGWVISLTLHDQFRRIMHSDEGLALVDEKGVTWLRGQVNSYGEIHSYDWPHDETPAKCVQREGFKLRIRPG